MTDPKQYPSSNERRPVRRSPDDAFDEALSRIASGDHEFSGRDTDDGIEAEPIDGRVATTGGDDSGPTSTSAVRDTAPALMRTEFDRWWLDGVEFLRALHQSPERSGLLCAIHQLDVPHHIVQLAALSIHRRGPRAFDPPATPPVTLMHWQDLIARRVRDLMIERNDQFTAQRRALRELRRPKTTLRGLAEVMRRIVSDQVVLSEESAFSLVKEAHRLVLAGPRVDGGWAAPRAANAPIEGALLLVCRFAIALAASEPTFTGDTLPAETIGELIPECLPSAPELVECAMFDRLGPLAVGRDGELVSARSRGGPVVLLGKSGVGKTASQKTMIHTTDGPMVITTTKPFDLADTVAVRGPRVHLLNATGRLTGLEGSCESVGWDPLTDVTTASDARRLADLVVMTELKGNEDVKDGGYWAKEAIEIVWPAMLFAASNGGSMSSVCRLISGDLNNVGRWCAANHHADGAAAIAAYSLLADNHRSSISTTAKIGVRSYADGLGGCIDEHSPVDWQHVIEDGGTIVMYSDDRTAARTRSYYVAVMDRLITAASEMVMQGWTGPKLTFLLDEAANCVPHPTLPSICAVAPGLGMNFVLAFQDAVQISRVWGEVGARELLNNAGAIVVHPGATDIWIRTFLSSLAPPTVVHHEGQPVGTAVGVPALPLGPGEVRVIDEHGRVTPARQLVAHEEPMFVHNRIERSVLIDPVFRDIVASQMCRSTGETVTDTTTEATRSL